MFLCIASASGIIFSTPALKGGKAIGISVLTGACRASEGILSYLSPDEYRAHTTAIA